MTPVPYDKFAIFHYKKKPTNHIIFIIITDNDNDNVMKSILKGFPSGGPQTYLCNEHIYAN